MARCGPLLDGRMSPFVRREGRCPRQPEGARADEERRNEHGPSRSEAIKGK